MLVSTYFLNKRTLFKKWFITLNFEKTTACLYVWLQYSHRHYQKEILHILSFIKTRTDKYDYCLIEHVLIVRQGSCSSVEVWGTNIMYDWMLCLLNIETASNHDICTGYTNHSIWTVYSNPIGFYVNVRVNTGNMVCMWESILKIEREILLSNITSWQ